MTDAGQLSKRAGPEIQKQEEHDMPNVAGPKTALIIGASRGLGLALADEYLKRGWHVVATVRGSAKTALHGLAEKSAGRLEI